MKKHVKSVLVSSLLAVAFGALSVGTTFALFTSSAHTDLEFEAGTVRITQEAQIISVHEYGGLEVEAGLDGRYVNTQQGVTYYDAETGILHMQKWCPGDKVVLEIISKNESDVDIKTRFEIDHSSSSTPDLYDALEITKEFEAGYSSEITEENFMEWADLSLPTTSNHVIHTLTVTVEFPSDDDIFSTEDNPYMHTNCTIAFTQRAVQGNAHIPDTSKGYADSYEEVIDNVTYEVNELKEPEHFEQMLDDLAEVDPTNAEAVEAAQKTIFKLDNDIDMEGSSDVNKGILFGTLDGQGHKIENVSYETEGSAAGIFAKYYDGAVVKNLELEDVEIKGKENVGALFGQSYPHASGASSTVADSELTIENVTIGENVIVSGTKGLGGIAGSTRWIEKLTVRNCVNYADVNAEVYNAGGFFGTLAGVKTLVMENCVNYGNIRGTHNVAGFVGQAPALESVTVTNCENHGRITDFSKNGSEANAGWFLACHKDGGTLNYTDNVNDGSIYYVNNNASVITVFEKDLVGDTAEAGIRVAEGKTYQDYMVLDDSVLINYEIVNNQFVVSEVGGAHHYTITMQVWGRDVRLEGNTATVYKEKYLATTKTYSTVGELHDGFGRITRAGYFLNSQYTEYDYDPTGGISNTSTIHGRANFFRLPYADRAAALEKYGAFNEPVYDAELGEWVYILDGEADCLPGTGHIMSPKNTTVSYVITAYDANNHVIANCVHKDVKLDLPGADDSGSFLMNMAGDTFLTNADNTDFDPVA